MVRPKEMDDIYKKLEFDEPCPETHMHGRDTGEFPCHVLRQIYKMTDDQGIKLKTRIATTMTRKMLMKLGELYALCRQEFSWSKLYAMTEGKTPMGKTITLKTYANRLQRKAEVFNKPLPLAPYLVKLLPPNMRVRIADLGSGPFPVIGNLYSRKRISIYACDFLAREYNRMMAKRGIVPYIPVEYQDMEHLTYPDAMFDIVHCANTLDHTEHPNLALREMVRICKTDGYIYLRHFINEGERKNYTGLHQWNLEAKGSDCRIWNKKTEFLLSAILPGASTFTRREGKAHEKIVSIYRKA